MPIYIVLLRLRRQEEAFRACPSDLETAVECAGRKAQVRVLGMYWTLGHYDSVLMLEASDDDAAAAFLESVQSSGVGTMETLRSLESEKTFRTLKRRWLEALDAPGIWPRGNEVGDNHRRTQRTQDLTTR
ncbi:MAG: GYD domain-containing protein [Planctomycetes bacterium]|nr:GYD domain-containing protein [Planctomycetota bacterium]